MTADERRRGGPRDGDDIERDRHAHPGSTVERQTVPQEAPDDGPRWEAGEDVSSEGMPVGGIGAGDVRLTADGRLTLGDAFDGDGNLRRGDPTEGRTEDGAVSVRTKAPAVEVDQGFVLGVRTPDGTVSRTLDRRGFPGVRFTGASPVGQVEYDDPALPVDVRLEAFSPFIPLNVEESSLPATVLTFTVRSRSGDPVEVTLAGWLENVLCACTGRERGERVVRRNRSHRTGSLTGILCTAHERPRPATPSGRPPVLIADLGTDGFRAWTPDGEPGADGSPDAAGRDGRLRSPTFTVERPYISFLFGGGPPGCGVHLVVDGKVERSAAGERADPLIPSTWDVSDLVGRKAHLEIVSTADSGADRPKVLRIELHDAWRSPGPMARWPDTGSLCLAVVGAGFVIPALGEGPAREAIFERRRGPTERPLSQRLRGAAGRTFTLEPGSEAEVTFVVTWFLPNAYRGTTWVGNRYATRFDGADAVASHVVDHLPSLYSQSRSWHETYYDSTVPRRLLHRVHSGVAARAATSRWWANGRFWARVVAHSSGSSPGDARSFDEGMARLFPSLERSVRDLQDFAPGPAVHPGSGTLGAPGNGRGRWDVHALAGYVLKARREHRSSSDLAFLRRNWSSVRNAAELLLARAANAGGVVQAAGDAPDVRDPDAPATPPNPPHLDAFRAAAEMAREMGDNGFVEACRHVLEGCDLRSPEPVDVHLGANGESAPTWSVLTALSGYEYHGPKRHIGFAPRLTPHRFRAAFTAAEGWGSFGQERLGTRQRCVLDVTWGRLPLKTMSVVVPEGVLVKRVTVCAGRGEIRVLGVQEGPRLTLSLPEDTVVESGDSLDVVLDLRGRD